MLAACSSGGGNDNGNGSNSSSSAAYGAGITSVVNPSTHKGGTLTFDWRSAPDSFDRATPTSPPTGTSPGSTHRP
jgi:peptide/nickel transport system substrate-binding protein